MQQHFAYFAKAYGGAIYSGLIYLMSVIAPAAHPSDVTFVQWIGFAATILGTWLGVAVITNGPKPVKQVLTGVTNVSNAAVPTADVAQATSGTVQLTPIQKDTP